MVCIGKDEPKVTGSIECMELRKKSLAKNAVFNVAYRILNVIFPLISAAYISRVLGPSGVGKVAYAQNIVSYFVLFAMLGVPRYGTREIAKRRDDPKAVNKLFSELFVINGISTAICALAFYAATCWGFFGSPLIYLVCGTELLFNFINIDWLYEGEEEYVYITIRSILIKVLSLALLFLLVKDSQDYSFYALIHSLGICGNNLFNAIHARKKVKLTFRGLNLKQHIGSVVILALSAIIGSLYNKLNVTILGQLQSEEIVGYYTNAYKMITLGTTLVTAMSAVFMPRLSYTFQHDREKFTELISSGTKIILLLAVPACVGMAMVADDLVVLVFGEQFLPAVLAMQIMSVVIVIMGVGDLLCYQAIISSGKERVLIQSRIVAGIVNVIVNLLLIPRLQHVGTAMATVVSELIVNGMLLKHSFALAKPRISKKFWGSLAVSTIVMALVVLSVQSVIGGALLSLLVSVALGIVVYFAVALVTKNEMIASVTMLIQKKNSIERISTE